MMYMEESKGFSSPFTGKDSMACFQPFRINAKVFKVVLIEADRQFPLSFNAAIEVPGSLSDHLIAAFLFLSLGHALPACVADTNEGGVFV